MKKCNNLNCIQVNPQSLDQFPIDKRNSDGHAGTCKTCASHKRKKSYIKNKKKENLASKEYHQKNREKDNKRNKTWYQRNIKEARIKRNKYYWDNRTERRKKAKLYLNTPKGRFNHLKGIAKRRKIPFELTFDEFMIFWQKPCIYGCEIKTAGLDRIDSFKSYFLENIEPMCIRHNQAKNDLTPEQFYKLCLQVVNYYREKYKW